MGFAKCSKSIGLEHAKDILDSRRADRTLIPRFRAVCSPIELCGRDLGRI